MVESGTAPSPKKYGGIEVLAPAPMTALRDKPLQKNGGLGD